MNAHLGKILADPARNGIYRIKHASGVLATLDGRSLADKSGLLAALAWVWGFPEYYGANWDALEECLTDMSWHPGAIALHIAHADAVAPDQLATLIDVFADAAAYWRERGRVCSLFLSGLEILELPLAG